MLTPTHFTRGNCWCFCYPWHLRGVVTLWWPIFVPTPFSSPLTPALPFHQSWHIWNSQGHLQGQAKSLLLINCFSWLINNSSGNWETWVRSEDQPHMRYPDFPELLLLQSHVWTTEEKAEQWVAKSHSFPWNMKGLVCCSTLGLVEMECEQVREINLCARGFQLSLSLYYWNCTRELLPFCELPAKSLQEAKVFAPHLPGQCGSFGHVEESLTPFCFSRSGCGSKGRGKVRQEIWLPLKVLW